MNASSLRLRLLALAVISIVTTLAVAGVSLGVLFEHQMLRRVDRELDQKWTELAASFQLESNGQPELREPLTDPRYQQPYSGAYWQIATGPEVVLRSRSLWDQVLGSEAVPEAHKARSFEIDGPEGAELYVVERNVILGDKSYRLAVALDHTEVLDLRQAFERDVAVVLGLIAIVLSLAAWAQLTLGLDPLKALMKELKDVRDGCLSRLGGSFPSEIAPLVDDLNKLLDRQEQLVRKARDRAGALAHGLKTPLTILRAETRRLEMEGRRDTAGRMNEQIDQIRLHAERELARSRTSGASAAIGTATHIGRTVERLLRLMRRMPRGEDLEWVVEVPADLAVGMDADDLGEVLGNLLDNARKWARIRVTVSAEATGDLVHVAVEDDGPGFLEITLERGVAGEAEGSTGLGLSIVRDALAEYDAELMVETGNGRCRVSFGVPLRAASAVMPHAWVPKEVPELEPDDTVIATPSARYAEAKAALGRKTQ